MILQLATKPSFAHFPCTYFHMSHYPPPNVEQYKRGGNLGNRKSLSAQWESIRFLQRMFHGGNSQTRRKLNQVD